MFDSSLRVVVSLCHFVASFRRVVATVSSFPCFDLSFVSSFRFAYFTVLAWLLYETSLTFFMFILQYQPYHFYKCHALLKTNYMFFVQSLFVHETFFNFILNFFYSYTGFIFHQHYQRFLLNLIPLEE